MAMKTIGTQPSTYFHIASPIAQLLSRTMRLIQRRLLAFLQEIEDVSTEFVRIISPIPVNFPVGTCQRIIVLGTPSAYCRVCLRQLLIQPHMHDSCHGTSRNCCTHHTSPPLEGSDDLHAHLDRDPCFGTQQRFARFVPVEDDVVTRMPDLSVLEHVPDFRQQRHDPVADGVDVRPTTHGSKGLLGYVVYLDVVQHRSFLGDSFPLFSKRNR